MYGLPSGLDLSLFVGAELIGVSFSSNTVDVSFDGDRSITVLNELRLVLGPTTSTERVPVASSVLPSYIGRRVVEVEGRTDGTLCMEFDDGRRLEFIDDTPAYEAYWIHVEGKQYIV